MKFSVIIPVYNTEDYIGECIESILQQTYQDFEIILVNDGSTDQSSVICEEYKEKCIDKVICIHKENSGPYESRICGMKKSKGDILIFLDSDDYLRKDALYLLKDIFEQENCDMVIYNMAIDKKFEEKYVNYNLNIEKQGVDILKEKIYITLIKSSLLNSLCTKAIKKELLDIKSDYKKFVDIKHGEDLLQTLEFITKAHHIVYLNQNLYYYRQREGSIVHKFDIKRSQSIKKVHKELEKYIEIWGMQEYKSVHNTRKVRGCIDSVLLVLKNRKEIDKKMYRKVLMDLSDDEYFRDAFQNMDKSLLSYRYLKLAIWLYNKKFVKLNMYGFLQKIWGLRRYVK